MSILLIMGCSSKKGLDSKIQTQPNIIVILADDLGYGDISCYGQEEFQTPNIDKLTSSGIKFTRHYVGSTVCAPSRSSLMTGQHTGHTYIRGNKEIFPIGQEPLPDSIITFPELLKKAGYTTGAFGKWGLGFPNSEGSPLNQGFDDFFGYNCQRNAHHYYPWHLFDGDKKILLDGYAGANKQQYAPEIIQKRVIEFTDSIDAI
ncbi:MAG: sulfatase-like hydrolase/transferase [Bacteroidales bacterium]|nr:sulfatase-like hydrolase/transferase [Bacteroidales bacterium]